ncbi:unnamed protein product [Chondrus crispus]|uniref:Uncharacterized protein n=1 Tax=Chondrus crispus TaxID=2769 RepID=S0F2X7_CHOCR|nr:unnamed protein product [Chondrus crispus]CDF77485.1 unnamed protein product [Chondrus crispus]|eukprot:XP_005712524.1 unnamed protein product [Chondrus crispus]
MPSAITSCKTLAYCTSCQYTERLRFYSTFNILYQVDILNRPLGFQQFVFGHSKNGWKPRPHLTKLHPSATHKSTAVARVSLSLLLSKHKSRRKVKKDEK